MLLVATALAAPSPPTTVQRIHLGSCAYSRAPRHPTWRAMAQESPDLVVLLGDIVYANTEDPVVLTRTLERLGRRRSFRQLREKVPILHTWDDHDYGPNDSDQRHSNKEGVRTATLDFFGAGPDDPRRNQAGGIYGSWAYGEPGKRVQILLLDTRWDLSPRVPKGHEGVGRYAPGEGQILGESQWTWLVNALEEPADLRIVGSSIPFGPAYTGWETWANFPAERDRLSALLQDAGPVLVVSGDVHYSELSQHNGIYDLTSSGIATHPYGPLPNANRVDGMVHSTRFQFGSVAIDWEARTLVTALRDHHNQVLAEKTLSFEDLDAPLTP